MWKATLTSKGQVTIPTAVREALGVTTGDRIELVEVSAGHFELIATTYPVAMLKGLIPKPKKPVSVEAMNAAIKLAGCSSGLFRLSQIERS